MQKNLHIKLTKMLVFILYYSFLKRSPDHSSAINTTAE